MKRGFSALETIKIASIIRQYFPNVEILVFGSRLNGDFKEGSDIDICLKSSTSLSLAEWAKLESDFSQSDLPFKVDIVDWSRASPEFRKIIEENNLKLN